MHRILEISWTESSTLAWKLYTFCVSSHWRRYISSRGDIEYSSRYTFEDEQATLNEFQNLAATRCSAWKSFLTIKSMKQLPMRWNLKLQKIIFHLNFQFVAAPRYVNEIRAEFTAKLETDEPAYYAKSMWTLQRNENGSSAHSLFRFRVVVCDVGEWSQESFQFFFVVNCSPFLGRTTSVEAREKKVVKF